MKLRRLLPGYLVLAMISAGGYLLLSDGYFRAGFPLDDAWIHQTYARNLASSGEWTFQQGIPSTGSTAPLWTLLLAFGHLVHIPPLAWNFVLGSLTLAALALVAAGGLLHFIPQRPAWAGAFGALLIFEWHLVWAAASGMETLLFGLAAAGVIVLLLRGEGTPLQLGVLVGLAVWVRPDGITLAGPVFAVLLLGGRPFRDVLSAFLGLLLLVLPYAGFNLALSGELLPATFFAKQAEYAVLRGLPLGGRLAAQLTVPLVGAGGAVVPGLFLGGWNAIRKRAWAVPAGLAWVLGTAVMYALRLPVTYQHGRYLIPVIPVWLILGAGPLAAVLRPNAARTAVRVLSRAWLLLLPVVTFVFYGVGGRAFARDVAVIESEMVDTANWIAGNLPDGPGILLAAHDIGALGYFSARPLLDMAGLVSPEVVPILRDEESLGDRLDELGADYLVTLEGWYPRLEQGLDVVYRTDGPFSPALGGTNMIVYRWSRP